MWKSGKCGKLPTRWVSWASVLVFVLTAGISSSKHIPSYAGPYKILLRRMHNNSEIFNATGTWWANFRATYPKPKQPQYVWGYGCSLAPLDDSYSMILNMATWGDNHYRPNNIIVKFPRACSDIISHAPKLVTLFWGDYGKKCPINMPEAYIYGGSSASLLKELYVCCDPLFEQPFCRDVKNTTFDLEYFPHFPVLPYGRWRADVGVIHPKTGKVLGVLVGEVELVPRL